MAEQGPEFNWGDKALIAAMAGAAGYLIKELIAAVNKWRTGRVQVTAHQHKISTAERKEIRDGLQYTIENLQGELSHSREQIASERIEHKEELRIHKEEITRTNTNYQHAMEELARLEITCQFQKLQIEELQKRIQDNSD